MAFRFGKLSAIALLAVGMVLAPASMNAQDAGHTRLQSDGTIELRTFLVARSVSAHGNPAAVRAVDLNNDGNLDLVVGNGRNLQVFIGHGDGSFESAVD